MPKSEKQIRNRAILFGTLLMFFSSLLKAKDAIHIPTHGNAIPSTLFAIKSKLLDSDANPPVKEFRQDTAQTGGPIDMSTDFEHNEHVEHEEENEEEEGNEEEEKKKKLAHKAESKQ